MSVSIKVSKRGFSKSKVLTDEQKAELLPYPTTETPPVENITYTKEEEEGQPQPQHQEPEDLLADLTPAKFQQSKLEQESNKVSEKDQKKFEKELERQHKLSIKEQEKQAKEMAKQMTRQTKTVSFSSDPDNDLFSEKGTELLGRDRIILLKKINQYKQLFPDKLKSFKIKKNPTTEELTQCLEEMSVLIDVSSIDEFVSDSVFSCIKIVEGVTAKSQNYNITGLSNALKSNPQFNNLLKILYIKYNTFSNIPPEYQVVMIVATTSWLMMGKNKNRKEIDAFLNQPVPFPQL